MEVSEFRLLIIGGKAKDVPRDRILCSFSHYDSDEAKNRLKRGEISFTLGNEPHLILAFKDHVNHSPVERFKKAAKLYNIAFVAASGGFWSLVNKARARGFDVGPLIAPAERKPTGEVVKPPESETDLDPETHAWVNGYPTSAYALRVIGGQEIPVINTKRGISLLMKGRPLEFALALIKRNKMGTGKRGAIKQEEARQIVDKLEQAYKLKQFGIKAPQTLSVIKAVGFVMGTLSASMLKTMSNTKGALVKLRSLSDIKAAPVKPKPTSTPTDPRRDTCTYIDGPTEARCMFCQKNCKVRVAEYKKIEDRQPKPESAPAPTPTPAPEPEPEPEPTPKVEPEPAPELKPAKAYDPNEKITELYERLLSATSESASFMEQISALEDTVKRKDVKIRELEEKVKALVK